MNQRDRAYIQHMYDSILQVEEFSKGITSASGLRDSPLERAGIERMLTIIGEAAKNVSDEFKEATLQSRGKKQLERGTSSFIIILVSITRQSGKRSEKISRN